jgi:CheY-like chemotaxis protein
VLCGYYRGVLQVLVVDDHEAIRRHVGAWVAQTGVAEVVEVCSGAEAALRVLVARLIDVVLCDVHMEGIDGGELAEEMLRRGMRQRVVLFSAHRLDEHRGIPVLRKMAPIEQLRAALLGES